jgi:hypothetical protein
MLSDISIARTQTFLVLLASAYASYTARPNTSNSLKRWTAMKFNSASLWIPELKKPTNNIVHGIYPDSNNFPVSTVYCRVIPSLEPEHLTVIPLAASWLNISPNVTTSYGPHFFPLVFHPAFERAAEYLLSIDSKENGPPPMRRSAWNSITSRFIRTLLVHPLICCELTTLFRISGRHV